MKPAYYNQDQLDKAFAESVDSRSLNLILFVTEQCNFRCTYCYESFLRPNMPRATQEALINLVKRRAETLGHLSISWFGGEPLLARREITFLASQLAILSKEFGFSRDDSITTNGFLLTAEVALELIEADIRTFQISLDGPAEFHDQTRLKRSGTGTYKDVYSNLLNLRHLDQPFQVAIRVHVTSGNYKSIPDYVEQIDHDFGSDRRFGLHLVPVEAYKTGASATFDGCVDPINFETVLEVSKQRIRGIFLLNTPKGHCDICYAAKANSFAIRSDGFVMKCTVGVDDERNILGRLNQDGSMTLDKEKLLPWMAGFKNGDLAALACPFSKLGQ